jgi:penicillin-binding protein 1A
MGITSRLQAVCSITLGTQAVTPLEMTDAYATLAARGIHHAPQALEVVRGPRGGVVGGLRGNGKRAIPTNVADLVTYALQGVVQHGTGTAAYFGRPIAGKTGTAEDYKDAWFCGYVRQLAACVWIGYAKGEIPLLGVEGWSAVFGGSLPAEIWNRFMSQAVANLPAQSFAYPVFTGHTISSPYSYSSPSSSSSSSSSSTYSPPPAPAAPAPAPAPAPKPAPKPPKQKPPKDLPPSTPPPSGIGQ